MRTKLRSKITLLFVVVAALIAIPAVAAFAQAASTIQSDKADYAPGELVTLTGSGWQPGESVHINVNDTYGATWSRNVDVSANANGEITDSFNLPNSFVSDYDVTATGIQSGTVRTTFTDALPASVTVNPTSQIVTQGTSATYGVNVDMTGSPTPCAITLSAVGLPSGATPSFSGPNPNTTAADYTSNLTVGTTGVNPGTYTFNVNASKPAGCNGAATVTSSGQLTLKVNSADSTAPVVTPNVVGTLGDNGWYTSNVSVSWTVTDAESTVTSKTASCDTTATINTDTAGQTVSCTATSAGGTKTESVTIKRDATAPVITNVGADNTFSTPNAAGWYKTDVRHKFSASDNLSGFAGGGTTLNFSKDISQESLASTIDSGTVKDLAGNTATAIQSSAYQIDKTKPVITDEGLTPAQPDGDNGWYVTAVDNGFEASDGLSGFVGQSDPYLFSKSSGNVEHDPAFKINSGTVTDKAGNVADAIDGQAFKIDTKAPAAPSALDLLASSDTGSNTTDNVTNDNTPSFSVNAEAGSTVRIYKDDDPTALGSALADASGVANPVDSSQLADGTYTIHATATDEAGNVSASSREIGVKIDDLTVDTAAPSSNATPDQPANAAGWYKANVTVTLSGSDNTNGSGLQEIRYSASGAQNIADAPYDAQNKPVISSEGTTTFSYYAVDTAGNKELPANTLTIKVDKTAPTDVAGTLDRAANAAGWYNASINATFTGNDGLSGIDSCSSDGAYSGPDGTDKTVTGSCTDKAGNSASGSSPTFNYDATKPTSVTGTPRTNANANGWYNSAVTVDFDGQDATSGIDNCSTGVSYSGPDSAAASVSGSCTDKAGNSANGSFGLMYDATKPSLSPTVSPNPVVVGGSATASAGATDATSSVDSSSCDPVNTDTIGANQSVNCTATDKAGNTATKAATYAVGAAFNGFLQPIDGHSVNTGKYGRTYPIKWQLRDSSGALISDSAAQLLVGTMTGGQKAASCTSFDLSDTDALESATTGNTALRYDATSDQFIYNYKAPSSGSCYVFAIRNADGLTTQQIDFKFTK